MYYEREWKPEASKHEIQKAKKEYEKILKDYLLRRKAPTSRKAWDERSES